MAQRPENLGQREEPRGAQVPLPDQFLLNSLLAVMAEDSGTPLQPSWGIITF